MGHSCQEKDTFLIYYQKYEKLFNLNCISLEEKKLLNRILKIQLIAKIAQNHLY